MTTAEAIAQIREALRVSVAPKKEWEAAFTALDSLGAEVEALHESEAEWQRRGDRAIAAEAEVERLTAKYEQLSMAYTDRFNENERLRAAVEAAETTLPIFEEAMKRAGFNMTPAHMLREALVALETHMLREALAALETEEK